MVNPDLEVWIRERIPKSVKDSALLAEVFMSARTGTRRTTFGRDRFFAGKSKSDGNTRGGGVGQNRNQFNNKQLTTGKLNPVKKSHSGVKSDVRCCQCCQVCHT